MGIVREISPELDPVEFPDNMDEAAVDAFMAQRGRELRQGLIARRQAQLAAETEGDEALAYREGKVSPWEYWGSVARELPQKGMRQAGQLLRGTGQYLASSPMPRERGEMGVVDLNRRLAQRTPQEIDRDVEGSMLRQLGTEIVADAPERFPTLPGVRESLPSQVSAGLGSVAALLPAGLTGPAAPFVGGAMYGLSAGEDFADDAEQVINSRIAEALAQGNTEVAADLERRKFDMKNTARMAGRAIGAGTEGVLGLAGKIRVGKSQIGGIGSRLAERMVPKSAPAAVQNAVRGAVEGGLTEAAQEGTEQILGNAAALAVYDPNRGIMDDVAQSVLVGGLTGKVVGGAFGSRGQNRDPLPASRAAVAGEVVPGTEIPQDIGAPDLTLEDLGDLLPVSQPGTPVPATQETPENIGISQATPVPEAGVEPAPETPAVDSPTLSPATAAETPTAPETPASPAPSSSAEGVTGEKPRRIRKAKVAPVVASTPQLTPEVSPESGTRATIPPDDTAMEAATAAAMAGRAPAPVTTAPDAGIAERAAVDAAMEQATRRASETSGAAAMNRAPEEGIVGGTTPKIGEDTKTGPVIYDSGIPARPFALQKGEKPAPGDLLFATREEAEAEFANAARIEAANKASREKWQAKEAQEKAEKSAREDLDGYEATLSPMQRARAVKALTKAVKYKGKEQSIRDVIRGMVADGATVKEDRLERPDGSFIGQKTLTKMGLDYARHLAAKREPTITSTPAAEPSAAQAAKPIPAKERLRRLRSVENKANRRGYEPLTDQEAAELVASGDVEGKGKRKGRLTEQGKRALSDLSQEERREMLAEGDRLDAEQEARFLEERQREIDQQQREDEAEFAKEGKLTAQQRVDMAELREVQKQRGKLGELNSARLAWLESKAPQPDILERALNAAIKATDPGSSSFSDAFLIGAVGMSTLNAALRIVRRVYLKTRDLARAKRQGMRLIRRQLRSDKQADLPKIEEAFNQLVEGTAEKPGPDQIEAFQAADGTRRQKSRGLFTGDVTVDTDAEWQAGAERWINQFNGNIRRAFEAARSTDYATTGLNPAAQNYVFGRLLEMSEIAINSARNDVDMVRNINLQKEITDASRDSAAEAAKALGSRALVQNRIMWMYPILDYRKLIQENQKRLPFPDVVADEVRTWLQESGRKAVQEMRNAMTDADKVFAKELKTTVRDMRVVWRDVMTASVESQEAMRRKILEELVKAPELKGLSHQGYIDIANLLGKAWEKERARIFAAEFRKQVPLPSVKEDVRRKLFTAIPDILKWANLGLLDNEAFRNAVAPKFGVAKFDGETAKKLNEMAQRAQKVGGVNRDEIIKDMYRLMQTEGGVRWQDLARDYWYAAVLTALDTQVDNVLGIINGAMLTAMGMAMAKPEVRRIMGKAYTDGFYEGLKDFWPILTNGEFARSINFNQEQPNNTLEAIGASKNRFARVLQIGKYTGRFMEAINNINSLSVNQATAVWALSNRYPIEHVRRYMMPSEKVRQAAIDKAKAEGTRPELMMKRVRQIIQESIPVEVLLSAKEISDIAGFTNKPTGLLGIVYEMLNKASEKLPGLKLVTGTNFARFAFNSFNQSLNLVAPVALYRYYHSQPGRQDGPRGLKFGEEHRKLILAQAAFGTALATFAAALFLGDDDEEKDRFIDINGSFKSLPDDKRKQLLSEGRLPYSIRIGDKYVSYRQLPFGAVLSAIGELRDRQLFAKKDWDQESIIRKFGDAMAAGILTIKDAPAISSFTEFLGVANAYKFDPNDQIEKTWPRYLAKLSGSFIPRALKQVDAWADPTIYKANTGHEFFVQQMPFARRTLGEGPVLNVLGEPVEVERYPWSRWLRTRKDDKAWSTLGELASNGVFLPVPVATVQVMDNGKRREMTPAESYRYQKRVGKAYRKFIEDNAERLLRMKPDEANEFIKNRTEQLRERLRNTKDA